MLEISSASLKLILYYILMVDRRLKIKVSYTSKFGGFPMSHNNWFQVQEILFRPGGNLRSIKSKLKEYFNFTLSQCIFLLVEITESLLIGPLVSIRAPNPHF